MSSQYFNIPLNSVWHTTYLFNFPVEPAINVKKDMLIVNNKERPLKPMNYNSYIMSLTKMISPLLSEQHEKTAKERRTITKATTTKVICTAPITL